MSIENITKNENTADKQHKIVTDFLGFLNKYRNHKNNDSKIKQEHTHTSLNNLMWQGFTGSYNIPQDKLKRFNQLYKKCIKHGITLAFTEKHESLSPIIIDLDLRFNYEEEDEDSLEEKAIFRKYNDKHINDILEIYINVINDVIDKTNFEDSNNKYNIYLLEKPGPVLVNQKDNCSAVFTE